MPHEYDSPPGHWAFTELERPFGTSVVYADARRCVEFNARYDARDELLRDFLGVVIQRSVMSPVDQEAVAREWLARGFSCDLWVDPPGQVWEDYRHATDELVMLIVGRLELEFGGRCLRPVVGEEIQIPAGVSHTVRNIGGTTAQWLYGYRRMQTG